MALKKRCHFRKFRISKKSITIQTLVVRTMLNLFNTIVYILDFRTKSDF